MGKQEQETKTEAKEGVSVRADRDENGRLLPGHSVKGGVRPASERRRMILMSIDDTIHPQQIADTIESLILSPQWRAKEAGAKLYLSYMAGPPTSKTDEGQAVLTELLERLRATRPVPQMPDLKKLE